MPRTTTRSRSSTITSSKGGRPRKKGSGIGLKFALPVSLVMVLIVGIQGWNDYSQTKRALNESIDSAGVFAASSLAAPDWHNADNQARLSDMLKGDVPVREVAIFESGTDGKLSLIATATGADELSISDSGEERIVGETTIHRGRMSVGSHGTFSYRSFKRSISRPGGGMQKIGNVQVFLSETVIEDELSSLLNRIIVFSTLGTILGVLTCFWVARVITRPLHTLVKDIQIVARGDFTHRTRATSSDEIGTLADAINEMTHGLAEGAQLKEELVSKEHQEQIIQEIQARLFPKTMPEIPGAIVDASCQPASEISSDLFDFMPLDQQRTGLLLLTASGQGIPAALVLAMARSALRSLPAHKLAPAEVLKQINANISPDLRRGMYVTAMYAIYDARDGSVTIASAGHRLPALSLVATRDQLNMTHPPGIAMGLDKGPVFDSSIEEAHVILEKGDTLLIGTSGILSLDLNSGEALGEQRFYKAAKSVMGKKDDRVAQKLHQRIEAHLAEEPGEHDITLVSLRRLS
ncbi:MAG: SpoIIE family protein phosphatase [Planctomycetota bacterium]